MLTKPRSFRPGRVVLAEDDKSAARLIEIALKKTGIEHDLEVVTDGNQAIAVLEMPADSPVLLLLDLYIPGKNGFEVLEHLKACEQLRRIPVVMLSPSWSAEDIRKAYELHANACVKRHTDFTELTRALDSVANFWLRNTVQ